MNNGEAHNPDNLGSQVRENGHGTLSWPKKFRKAIYSQYEVSSMRGLVKCFTNYWSVKMLGWLHVVASVLFFWILYSVWPNIYINNNKLEWHKTANFWGIFTIMMTIDQRLFLIVLMSGAIGSIIHSATSFTSYLGSREYKDSWSWWYVLRVPLGSLLAIAFYLVFRGGFLGSSAEATNISPYGVAAISILAGMFSKQAIDKLREVFDNLFKTEKPDQRRDKLGSDDKQEI